MKKISKLTSVLALAIVVLSSCGKDKGDIVTETIDLSNFTKVELNGSWDVQIEQGTEQNVVVTGHENVIADLNRSVIGNEWEIEVDENYDNAELTVYITIPTLAGATINGSGSMEIAEFNELNDLTIYVSGSGDLSTTGNLDVTGDLELVQTGSGDIVLEGNAVNVVAQMSGSGSIELYGEANNQSIAKSGSGTFRGIDFSTALTAIDCSGSGDTYVNVSDALTIDASGSGDIYYVGQPSIEYNNTGSGSLINQN